MKNLSFFLLTLFTLWSCSNDDMNYRSNEDISEATTFVRLLDNGTQNAGTVRIVADESEAELTWITSPGCNLDTTETTVVLKNGVAELPVKWLSKGENGKYAPQDMAFKAWLGIKTSNNQEYIPLIFSERVDSVKLSQSVQTRASNVAPRAASLYFLPPVVNLEKATGGTTNLKLSEVGTVDLDFTRITEAMNIDKSILPTTVVTESVLNFKWLNNQAPAEAFSTLVTAHSPSADLWVVLELNYDPNGSGGEDDVDTELKYVSDNMPIVGNLPAASKIFTFTFEGTYRGPIQIRTLADGVLLYTSGAYAFNGNQPKGRVLENVGAARQITFQYKRDGRDWTSLPASTNRIQDGNGGVIPPVPGAQPNFTPITPTGYILYAGGAYSTTFSNYEGQVTFRALNYRQQVIDSKVIIMAAGSEVQSTLAIPIVTSNLDNVVIFQFSTDGVRWTDMEIRQRVTETFASGAFNDMPLTIPAKGGVYHYSSSGTLSAKLNIIGKDDNGVVLVNVFGDVGTDIPITVPENKTGRERSIFFWYIRGDVPGKYNSIRRADQAGY